MTSIRFNLMKAFAAEEMADFDRLPSRIREAMRASGTSVRSQVVLAALLRGASEDEVISVMLIRFPHTHTNAETY